MLDARGDATDGPLGAILGLFSDPDSAADAVDALEAAGHDRRRVTVLTGNPYPHGAFGEEPEGHRLYRYPVIGAICGFAVGLLVTIGTQLAYPLVTGGKPLLSIPPMFIIIYGGTLLGAVLATVGGVLVELRLPTARSRLYDPRITEGYIGVLVARSGGAAGAVNSAQLLRDAGAVDVIVEPEAGHAA